MVIILVFAVLKEDSEKIIDDLILSDAVTAVKDAVTPCCFKTCASELRPAVEHLYIMTWKCRSELFQRIWKMQIQQFSSDKRKSPSEFVNKVWEVTFIHCKALIKRLQELSIDISEVDNYFNHLNRIQVQTNLEHFSYGICECDGSSAASMNTWIKVTVEHIERYRQVKQYAETAEVFLALKECLHLSGDFGDIKSLSNQVNVSFSLQLLHCASTYFPCH